ncbi:hypothetical protein J582_2615 [Acinetobacter sp. 1566109]|nr:hypothetical protein J582_2615 [Acinetobacter sp. 1566109]
MVAQSHYIFQVYFSNFFQSPLRHKICSFRAFRDLLFKKIYSSNI